MQFHAIKNPNLSYYKIPTWDLKDDQGNHCGSLYRNDFAHFWSVSLLSRYTGLPQAARMWDSKKVSVKEVLAWARDQIESEPVPTYESLTDAIERLEEGRRDEEAYNDYAYSSGRLTSYDNTIRKLKEIRDRIG